MNLRLLSVRDLNAAARAVTRDLIPRHKQNSLTVHTPYLTCTEFRFFMRIYRLHFNHNTFRQIRNLPTQILESQITNVLAEDVPEQWCITIPDQHSRDGLIHIIPTTHLSHRSQLLAKKHGYGRSFTERLNPDAKIIFTLLLKDPNVSYTTAAQQCPNHLARSTFFHIKKRLLSQERYFSWKLSSSH